jgi:outer membrane receptor protein involved in Fe transport
MPPKRRPGRRLARAWITLALAATLVVSLLGSPVNADTADATASDLGATDAIMAEVVVTAKRLDLLGSASTASEGVVDDAEIQLLPAYRPGQLLETVPGLIVTLHSGEGKANQFLMRGYNLDHGTDLATFVDGMPVNQPTHAHGQGYTDLNFMIPELAQGITYTKGPYYADVGDFGAVGSVHVSYRDDIADQVSATLGTLGFQRTFAAGSWDLQDGRLLAATELQHYDGPFDTPDNARKVNALLRYSAGNDSTGYSLTAMLYHQLWTNTTDIPLRALSPGVVPNRFGSLDPTDGGRAWRGSLSFDAHAMLGAGQLTTSAYLIDNQLHIYNDFTHFLVNPVAGDQEDQFENRRAFGGQAGYSRPFPLGPFANEISVGVLAREDIVRVGRLPTADQLPLASSNDPPSFYDNDQVYLFAGAAYLQATTHWTDNLRSVLGLRADFQHGTDIDYLAALHETAGYSNGGTAQQALAQPKGSLIYSVSPALEFYASAGRGFHSADIRGVNQDTSVDLGLPHTALLARQEGQEIGVRTAPSDALTATLSLYNLWQQSETILDPDVGQDSAGPPSRRYGLELNVTFQINQWLEFHGSVSGNHTRFTRPFDDGTGHEGTYITDAPSVTGSLALYLTDFGPWSGGLDYRYLGSYPLSSGPCVDAAAVRDFPGAATSCANAPTASGQVNGTGFGELNLDVHYALPGHWSASLGVYNLLNSHAPAAEFWYVDRLQTEVDTYPEGRADIHQHPLEPPMARLTLTRTF